MPDMPRTKFNSPWTVENIEAELNGTKNARGNLTMTEKFEQKVETSTYATDKAALDAEIAEDRAALVELVDGGAKNLLPLTGESTDIFTINADGTMTANGSSSTSKRDFAYYIGVPPKGRFVFSGCPPTGSNTTYRMFLQSVVGSTYTTLATLTGDSVEVDLTNIDKIRVLISIYGGYTPNNIKFSPMLCTKAEWDISQAYEPYALPNPTLTPAAIKAVDEGVKNLIDVGEPRTITLTEVTVTVNSDGTLNATTSSATAAERNFWLYDDKAHMPDGIEPGKTYCFYSNSGTSDFGIDVWNSTNGTSWDSHFVVNVGTFVIVTIPTATVGLGIRMNIPKSKTLNNVKAYPMICTVEDWAVSQKFVPYCPTLYELYQMVLALQTGRSVQSAASLMRAGRIDASEQTEAELEEEADA